MNYFKKTPRQISKLGVTYLITDHHKDWLGQWWIVQSWWERASFRPSFLPKYIWTCCICVSGSTFVLLFLLHCLLAACVYNLDSLTFASMVSLTSHIHSRPTLVWLMRLLPSPGPQPSLFNCAFLHLVHHNDGSLVSSFTVYGNKRRDWWPITQSYKLQFAFNYYLN